MDLEVEGLHALLFDDDTAAAFVNSREALVPWNHDASLLIDRYDVRHLLDRIPPRPVSSTRRQRLLDDACDAVSLAELDGERYQDLPPPGDEEGEELDSETGEKSEATSSGAYQAVPFSYGDQKMSSIDENIEYNSGFRPPFEVPEFLINHLPPTEKLHQIMARTAIFVSEHGGQSEIVLRVKQGNNPTFGFLMPDHQLHAYFRYLVDHPRILHHTDSPIMEEDKSYIHTSEAGALSLLGSVYGTGDDDDAIVRTEIKETEYHNLVAVGNISSPMKAENDEPPTAVLGNEGEIKLPPSNCAKVKPLLVNKATAIAVSRKTGDGGVSLAKEMAQSCHKGPADLKSSVLEPPTFLKRTIEKIVEFIVRNGKQFEAVLIEQDRNIGRFPFLLSTNQYHSYYLKIIEEAQEMKMQGKNLFDDKNDAAEHHNRGNKKKVESHGKDAKVSDRDLAELSEDAYYDPQRKEKFKMVLGGHKNAKHSGLSADEAAAVVLAATRGVSPANGGHSSKNSGATADEAAAIVMAATRGRSPANAPQKTSSDVAVATVIAQSVALAASSEADSAEAGLTKEQQLKAERLKRAKMFAALIKSGSSSLGERVNSASNHSGSMEPSNGGSKTVGIEREGSSVPFNAEALGGEHESRKRRRSRYSGHRHDSDEDHKQSRKKQHLSSHSSSKEKKARHHHDRRSSSDDEYGHKRSSEHRHRHRRRIHDHSSSDDGDRERSEQHRRKHRSHTNQKRENKAGDALNPMEHSDRRDISASDQKQSSDAAEIPSDLRAKIRAMLLETL